MKTICKQISILILTILLHSCGNGLDGTYIGQENAYLEEMTFSSGEKVELVRFGSVAEGTYIVEDKKVKINTQGEIQILFITDDGCLDGEGFIGKYCKD